MTVTRKYVGASLPEQIPATRVGHNIAEYLPSTPPTTVVDSTQNQRLPESFRWKTQRFDADGDGKTDVFVRTWKDGSGEVVLGDRAQGEYTVLHAKEGGTVYAEHRYSGGKYEWRSDGFNYDPATGTHHSGVDEPSLTFGTVS